MFERTEIFLAFRQSRLAREMIRDIGLLKFRHSKSRSFSKILTFENLTFNLRRAVVVVQLGLVKLASLVCLCSGKSLVIRASKRTSEL